jgi:hypothetical protein
MICVLSMCQYLQFFRQQVIFVKRSFIPTFEPMRLFVYSALAVLFTASCKQPWTDKERKSLMGGCLTKAVPDMGEAKAKAYCQCMLQQVEARYPNAADVKYLSGDTTVYSLGRRCRDSVNKRVP